MRHTITLKLLFDDAVFKISPSSLKKKKREREKITGTLAQFSKCSKNITPELLLVFIPQWKSTKSSSWLLSTRSTRWVEVTEPVAAPSWTESFPSTCPNKQMIDSNDVRPTWCLPVCFKDISPDDLGEQLPERQPRYPFSWLCFNCRRCTVVEQRWAWVCLRP